MVSLIYATMINHFEVPKYLERNLPGFCCAAAGETSDNVYQVMQQFSSYTSGEIQQHHFRNVRTCFALAERLYEKGNILVRSAVENIYVYSFTGMLQKFGNERKAILGIIPITLYTLYIKQIQHPGC